MASVDVTTQDGHEYTLRNIQTDNDSTDGMVDVTPFVTFDSDEAFLVSMTQQERFQWTGQVSGGSLSADPDYADDPHTAVAEWVQRFMATVNGSQGEGHTIEHGVRGMDPINVVFEDAGWSVSGGERAFATWNATARRGEGVMVSANETVLEADPGSEWSLDGVGLGRLRELRESKRQQINEVETLLADDPGENLIYSNGGVVRNVTITGVVTGSADERLAFDNEIKSRAGVDETYTYSSPFPGHELSVMVDSYDSDLEAGAANQTEYSLELVEGTKS